LKNVEYGFYLFDILIPYYGLMILIGLIVGISVGLLLCKREKKDINDFILLISFTGLGALIGAKLLYLIVSLPEIDINRFFTDYKYFHAYMQGGFVFYGGVIGGMISCYIGSKATKIDIKEYLSISMPGIAFAHGFGRLGCNLAGCCYGIYYDGPFSRIYEHSLFAPNHVHLFPVQVVEAIFEFMIAFILLYVYFKITTRYDVMTMIYLTSYSLIRFILEFFRGDAVRGFVGILSTSQVISLLILIVIIICCLKKTHVK
jgi:phosphatidylglycerol:prolipoprotein diacylglycerol transferase